MRALSSAFLIALPLALVLSMLMVSMARAGTNEGGVLLIHAAPEIQSSTGLCGWANLRDPKDAVTQVPADGNKIPFCIYAAFDDFARPDIQGVNFGIEYTGDVNVVWDNSNTCADFVLAEEGWPASRTGIALTFMNRPLKRQINEVCWFVGYAYSPGTVKTIACPGPSTSQFYGAFFGDESVPSVLDAVEGFGILGFGQQGFNPMGGDDATGACCNSNGACTVQTRGGCDTMGGSYIGDNEACFPSPCAPAMGACCVDVDCRVMAWNECLSSGGTFMGTGSCTASTCNIRIPRVSWSRLKNIYRQ
jgi:hypothetical protein